MPRELSAIHLTALELPPAELVPAARRAGCAAVGLRIHPIVPGSVAYPFEPGSEELKAFKRLLADEGMRVQGVDGFGLTDATDLSAFARLFEACGELGIRSMCVSADAKNREAFAEVFAQMCDMAAPYGFRIDLEFMAWHTIGTLEQAYEIVRLADRPNGTIAVDAVHLMRSGGKPEDLAKIPPRFLGDFHLCDGVKDAPIAPALVARVQAGDVNFLDPAGFPAGFEGLIREARGGRRYPGAGELPLIEMLRRMPEDAAVGVEVPVPGMPGEAVLKDSFAHAARVMAEAFPE